MKSIIKITSIAVLLILAGNKAGQSCSASSKYNCVSKERTASTATANKPAATLSLMNIVYSPGISF